MDLVKFRKGVHYSLIDMCDDIQLHGKMDRCVNVRKKNPETANDGVDSASLHMNQIIPISDDRKFLHHVIETNNETFWNLSKQYDCTIDEIKAVNPKVSSTTLQIGQVIRISNKLYCKPF